MIGSKDILYGAQAREKLIDGINKVADVVKVTLGPSGYSVILDKMYQVPRVTKDGVTVARDISLDDSFEDMGAKLLKQVANKTVEEAGDGTTTSIVLAQSLIQNGLKELETGRTPLNLKHDLDTNLPLVLEFLKDQSRIVETFDDLVNIGTIASNGDAEIGQLLAQVFTEIGKEGAVTLETSRENSLTSSHVDGLQFPKGFLSPAFINTPKNTVEFTNPLIFISESFYYHEKSLDPVLQAYVKVCKETHQPLLIIASDVKENALANCVANKLKGNVPICVVQAPYEGIHQTQFLTDLAVLTGATPFLLRQGKLLDKSFEPKHFGSVDRVVIGHQKTVLIRQDRPVDLLNHCEALKALSESPETTAEERDILKTRLAYLTTGVTTIRVGGKTEPEALEKKDRLEDAIHAVRAALEEGVSIGGGRALVAASRTLKDAVWFSEAIEEPFYRILLNQGLAIPEGFYQESAKDFDPAIIDPTKVIRCALENACSIASLILTTQAIVTASNPETQMNQMNQIMKSIA